MHLEAVPLTQKKANELVEGMHRHHPPVRGDIFQIGAVDETEKLVGVIQVGRPVSRILDDGKTCEVTRLCTDGTRNACSFLYARAARAATAIGYSKIITYILQTEPGASLRAAGWSKAADVRGKSWSCQSRPRDTTAPTCDKERWEKILRNE